MKSDGFTLIEVLVVMAITVMIAGFLIANFSRTRIDLNQTMLTITDAIREAQAQALSGVLERGTYRCGYGIHFTATGYMLYAGPDVQRGDCALEDRNYDGATDTVIRQALLSNTVLEIVLPAPDIFFEPPNPTTYIDNDSTPGKQATITVRRRGTGCSSSGPSSDCRTINVTTSGRIQLQ